MPRNLLLLLAFAAAAVAATVPATAQAATVSESPAGVIIYNASGGEDNELAITQAGDVITFEEASLPITAFAACWQAGLSKVECPAAQVTEIGVNAGDGVNEVVASAPHATTIIGAPGSVNTFTGGPSGNLLIGGVNHDVLTGGAGNDELRGNDGVDEIAGMGGTDTLDGGVGADRFLSATVDGADAMDGGPGVDTADYSARVTGVTVSVDNVANDGGHSVGPFPLPENDNVDSSVENVSGGAGDDTLVGSSAANSLSGGAGADRLAGGLGADLLAGGTGHDVVSYAGYAGPVTVDLDGAAGDDGLEGELDTVVADVEDILGGSGPDALTGNAAANEIRGGAGNDLIDGLGGSDLLSGETGDDELRSTDGLPDSDYCGDGTDTTVADPLDVRVACEQPAPPAADDGTDPGGTDTPDGATPGADPSPAPSLGIGPSRLRLDRRGGARLRVACPASAAGRCAGTLTIRREVGGATRRCGRRDFSIPAGRTATVRTRVTRSLRRALAHGRVRVQLLARAHDALSTTGDTRTRVTLLRPAPRR
jgi:Ca2+-binding RTX toxin-like protein